MSRRTRTRLAWAAGTVAFLLMLYFFALPGALPASEDRTGGLPGTYTVNGTDPTGGEYSGTVVITGTDAPDTFALEWIITGALQRGTGIRSGNQLAVTWTSVASGNGSEISGTGTYAIGDDGRLTGTWQLDDGTGAGSEEIVPEP
ncbi:MAG: hypothetical protein R2761_25260 [Acidimicrobiales bacterium]